MFRSVPLWLAAGALVCALAASAQGVANVPRVTAAVNDSQLVVLRGNTHPLANSAYDQGQLDSAQTLDRMVLVLQRSDEQEAALKAFIEREYDPSSPDYHQWIHADDFGRLYGPADTDVAAITAWLQSHGLQVGTVSKGRLTIEFSGTVGQVEEAFHIQMHRYLVTGAQHIANDRDPQIPAALAPVVTGIASLNDFFPTAPTVWGKYVKRDRKTGKTTLMPTPSISTTNPTGRTGPVPQLTYIDDNGNTREDITPYDFAAIYNLQPLWKAGINGAGQTIAISGASDVTASDVSTFRSSFGLPSSTVETIHNGSDPGLTGAQGENTLDVEWSGATAPGAKIVLVVSGSTSTSFGGQLSDSYIVDHETAKIMSASYGECELNLGTSGNKLYNGIWQQGAAEGISIFESAGDQGSAGCESQDTPAPNASADGLQVNGMASSPYVTAVGGTDFVWNYEAYAGTTAISTYWNSSNNSDGATAKGYIPEIPWNSTCANPLMLDVFSGISSTETLCNDSLNSDAYQGLVVITGGSGGVSACTTPSGTTPSTCSGGYAKPTWQTGVSGIPSDGKRDVPDISLFASGGIPDGIDGSAYLMCQASSSPDKSCDFSNPDYIIYQETGGTSVSSPAMAGIMALVNQKLGTSQGFANPVLYKLAAQESISSCKSTSVGSGNSCIFYDITEGSNAQTCITGDKNCVTHTSGDELGILSAYSATTGYDLATGLGSMNVSNLVNKWPQSSGSPVTSISPSSLTFSSTAVGSSSAAQTVTVKNTGTATLTISSVSITGTNSSSYSETNTCTTVAASATCTVKVTFKPTASGTLTASLSIADNASGSPHTVSLTGTGLAPVVSLSPSSLTFANTAVGTSSAAQTVTLKNAGNASLTVTGVAVSGTDASSFSQTNTCSTVATSASCTIKVTFKPAASGTLTAAISITDNAPGSPQKLTLTGTSAAPTITLSTKSISFPATATGSVSPAQTVTITNSGTATASLSSITLTGSDASDFSQVNNCAKTLSAGANCVALIEFGPSATGSLTATFSVADNASGSPQTASLSGTGGSAPKLSYTTSSTSFGTVSVKTTSVAETITISSSGTTDDYLTGITITGTNASDFKERNNCGSVLTGGKSCEALITFTPSATGSRTAAVNFTFNNPTATKSITFTGTGK